MIFNKKICYQKKHIYNGTRTKPPFTFSLMYYSNRLCLRYLAEQDEDRERGRSALRLGGMMKLQEKAKIMIKILIELSSYEGISLIDTRKPETVKQSFALRVQMNTSNNVM